MRSVKEARKLFLECLVCSVVMTAVGIMVLAVIIGASCLFIYPLLSIFLGTGLHTIKVAIFTGVVGTAILLMFCIFFYD
jgi:hypothetical protein